MHDPAHGLSNAYTPTPASPQMLRSTAAGLVGAPPAAGAAAAELAAERGGAAARTPGAVHFARDAPLGAAVACAAAAALLALVGVRRALRAAQAAAEASERRPAGGHALL